METMSFTTFLQVAPRSYPNRLSRRKPRRNAVPWRKSFVPRVEVLEERTLLAWQPIGPAPIVDGMPGNQLSGRVAAVAGHPTNPNIIYVAAATGGVWRTMDGGTSW